MESLEGKGVAKDPNDKSIIENLVPIFTLTEGAKSSIQEGFLGCKGFADVFNIDPSQPLGLKSGVGGIIQLFSKQTPKQFQMNPDADPFKGITEFPTAVLSVSDPGQGAAPVRSSAGALPTNQPDKGEEGMSI